MIELKNVCKWYGAFQVLDDCSTRVGKGEVVVVCGPSGSGKSTLIKTVNGLEPFQQGRIEVDGVDVGAPATDLPALRARIGMVFQNFELFPHLTVRQNLTLAQIKVLKRSEEEASAIGLRYLDRVGLKGQQDKLPNQLSGGQQQRVAIARALASRPAVLLCDEPTSALDPDTTRALLDTLRHINRELGVTIVIVSHSLPVLGAICDRVAVIEDGAVVEQFALNDTASPRKTALGRELAWHRREQATWEEALHA